MKSRDKDIERKKMRKMKKVNYQIPGVWATGHLASTGTGTTTTFANIGLDGRYLKNAQVVSIIIIDLVN